MVLSKKFMPKVVSKTTLFLGLALFSLSLVLSLPTAAQDAIDVTLDRWLRIQELSGDVEVFTATTSRAAEAGDLIAFTGDGVRTGNDSSCVLEVDINVGTITLLPNTELVIRELDYAPDDGRITRLTVTRGNVNLNLRRFTNRGSELEIETPSGVAGVRGTEFGIIVHPDNQRTAIATAEGEVFAAAQGVSVDVPDGFQTLIRLGEPPLEPMPIPAEPAFDFRVETLFRNGVRFLVLVGQINPINQVYVEDELQEVTDTGEFRYESFAFYGSRLQVRIVTPLGDVFNYDIALL